MKIEVEINAEELKKAIIDKLAHDYSWKIDNEIKDKMFKSIEWAKLTPHVQEAIIRMAAEKIFDRPQSNNGRYV